MTKPTFLIESKIWNEKIKYIAGVDEAGRGPLAGPVVSASVILPKDFNNPFLNDSKLLSKKKRNELFEIIKKEAISIGIGIIDNDIIDKVNILEATKLSMKEAINNLSVKPDFIIIDHVKLDLINSESFTKGDQLSLSIAAASVIAKVTRDNLMKEYDKLYPEYDFVNNQGYGTKKHLDALNKYGPTKIHRLTFKKVKK